MTINMYGESIPYTYKIQTDKKGITRCYCRANVIVSTDPFSGNPIKKEITAPSEKSLKKKIQFLQRTRSLSDGSLITFRQYMENWMSLNKHRLKPTSYYSYQRHLEKNVFPILESVMMADLNEKVFSDFFRIIIDKHSINTAYAIKVMLSTPMREAAEKFLTYGNPLSYVHLPKYQSSVVVPLLQEEAQNLISLCRDNRYGGPIVLALLLALRISEVIGLSVDAIDLPHRLIHINRQITKAGSKYFLQNYTKTNSERVLYLDDQAMEVILRELELREQKRIAAGDEWDDEYNCLFTYKNGHFIRHQALRRNFKKLAKEIGRPDLKFHHLRHTAATIVNDKLHDIDAAKTLLGHKNYNSTGIYVHSSAEKMKATAIAISDYVMKDHNMNSLYDGSYGSNEKLTSSSND